MNARPLIELTEYRQSVEPPLTLEALGEKFDVSAVTVWRWENGTRTPDRSNLLKIAALVNKPAAELAGLSESAESA